MKLTHAVTAMILSSAWPAWADSASERAAAELLEQRLKNEAPEELAMLQAVAGKDIVVVQGSMDHIEQILSAAKIRHTVVAPEQLQNLDLRGEQILMVNCPGYLPDAGIRKIERFVRAGGLLYTTDWALLNVVQKAFPGTIAHNGRGTESEVTPVVIKAQHDDLMSNMLLRKNKEPEWWLEGGSYPIKILSSKVEVLAQSSVMAQKYGAAPVVVRFKWHDGEVIHVVSHFYRQMSTSGPAVAAAAATAEMEGLSDAQKEAFKKNEAAKETIGDVESSYAFQRMTSNLITGKSRDNVGWRNAYSWTPKSEVEVDGRRAKKGERLRILSEQGGKVRVRDERGNEATISKDALQAY